MNLTIEVNRVKFDYPIFLAIFMFLSLTGHSMSDFQNKPIDTVFKEQLENGFTYYIKNTDAHSGKIYMNLVIKAGILQENHNQLDVAHATEHLVSKGSKNFPNGIASDSAKFYDKDIWYNNFLTGFHATQYNLIVSSESLKAFETATLFYRDIIDDVKFDNVIVDRERKVLKQEFLLRTGKQIKDSKLHSIIDSKLFPCRFSKENFPKEYDNFSIKQLKKFYNDWYRPELASLIIVGDIKDVDIIRKKVRETFNHISTQGGSKDLKNCDSIYFEQPDRFIAIKSKALAEEQKRTVELELYFKDPEYLKHRGSFKGEQRKILWGIFTKALNMRYRNLTKTYLNSRNFNSNYSSQTRPAALKLSLYSNTGNEIKHLNELMSTFLLFRQDGLENQEWQSLKRDILKDYNNKDWNTSAFWLHNIKNHVIFEEPLGFEYKMRTKDWLSEMSLIEINNYVRKMIPKTPEDISLIAPEENIFHELGENGIRKILKNINFNKIKPENVLSSPEIPAKIVNNLTKPGASIFINEGKNGEKIYKLENGIKIILKSHPPVSKNDKAKIVIHGFTNKGASSFCDKDYFTAINSAKIIKNSGVEQMNKFQLNKWLESKNIKQVSPYINYNSSGIKGISDSENFEELLQIAYLYFTAPRKDSIAFIDWKLNQSLINSKKQYQDITDAISDILGDKSSNPDGFIALQGLDSVDFNKSYEIYKCIFGDIKNFNFIITGDFSEQNVLNLTQQYLGNIPQNCISSDRNITKEVLPQGPRFYNLEIPGDHKNAFYGIHFIGCKEGSYNWKEDIKMKILGLIINDKIQNLRHENNFGTYSMGAGGEFDKTTFRKKIDIKIRCQPEELNQIENVCDTILNDIAIGNFSLKNQNKYKNRIMPYYLESYTKRSSVANQLLYDSHRGINQPEVNEVLNYIENLTVSDLSITATEILQNVYKYEFVLKP